MKSAVSFKSYAHLHEEEPFGHLPQCERMCLTARWQVQAPGHTSAAMQIGEWCQLQREKQDGRAEATLEWAKALGKVSGKASD